jgi:hypothetical protein
MSCKEDQFFLAEWNKKMRAKSEEHEINGEYAEGCEYSDVCRCAKIQCTDKNKYDCGDWHVWKHVDLENLFKDKKDENRNYLLDFYK